MSMVDIVPYKKNSWKKEWSEILYQELSSSEFENILHTHIEEPDLQELGCTGLNKVSDKELKIDFWVVFLSALTRAESAFNPRALAKGSKGGPGYHGLLQFAPETARIRCGLKSLDDIYNPASHLKCGLKLLAWQLEGGPLASGKLIRPDSKNKIFAKKMFVWGPLREDDKLGRSIVVGWFKKHLHQLPFCSAFR